VDFELGKSYHQLQIGEEASFTKTITETDVYLFAGISGDFNPLHVNEAFAKQTPFGTRIAHGGLPQSLIAPVLGTKLPGLGTIRWKSHADSKPRSFSATPLRLRAASWKRSKASNGSAWRFPGPISMGNWLRKGRQWLFRPQMPLSCQRMKGII